MGIFVEKLSNFISFSFGSGSTTLTKARLDEEPSPETHSHGYFRYLISVPDGVSLADPVVLLVGPAPDPHLVLPNCLHLEKGCTPGFYVTKMFKK